VPPFVAPGNGKDVWQFLQVPGRSDHLSAMEAEMEPIVERCCGLDVHQATVVACVLVGGAHQKPKKEGRTFGTKTRELMEMRDWLRDNGCRSEERRVGEEC